MKKICPHCKKEFESNHARRIYCSDSHRISAYNKRKGFKIAIIPPSTETFKPVVENKGLSGSDNNENSLKEFKNQFGSQLGASVLGSLASELLMKTFTKNENNPVTKKDLVEVLRIIQKDQINMHNSLQKTLMNNKKELIEEIKNNKNMFR
ncbi:hypothetical protein LNJ08_12330 [Tenacibaculum finnmarkense genomovar ulcerans]|uniref:hypothetical protein n=1 Tax=Tenacibaculum finnmarkense TaxID=2781243 RepID=UPI001E3D5EBF|nr:hypothetical protein [Tenacibaculum finnmarkense]MCD8455177.1 hypothetical protein [Tenacibaculum finnmarkense genomovar ulcerans]